MRFKGMHWRDIEDSNIRRLALYRAYECEPEMQDAEDEHCGSIEVDFGSSSAELTLRVVDAEATSLFMHGYCTLLAYELHLQTGLPFVLFTTSEENEGWSGHAGVLVGENQILDIEGVKSFESVQKQFKGSDSGRIVESEEFRSIVVSDEEYLEDPRLFVEELERFVISDFASFLLKENRLLAQELMTA